MPLHVYLGICHFNYNDESVMYDFNVEFTAIEKVWFNIYTCQAVETTMTQNWMSNITVDNVTQLFDIVLSVIQLLL